jgi:hypothetical protein
MNVVVTALIPDRYSRFWYHRCAPRSRQKPEWYSNTVGSEAATSLHFLLDVSTLIPCNAQK